MEINWSLLQPVDIGGNFQSGFQMGQQLVEKAKLKSALAAYSQDPTNPQATSALAAASPQFAMQLASRRAAQAAQAQERQRIGGIVSQYDKDPAGARREALEGGDIDLAEQLGKMGEDQRERLADMYKGAAPLAYQAMKLPYEQRKAYIDSVRPQLEAAGWTADKLDSFDPTDANLGGIVQSNMSLEQAMGRDKIDYRVLPPGAKFEPFNSRGEYIGSSSSVSGSAPVVTSSAPPAGGKDFNFNATPGAKVTSAARSAKHNKAVGGVANSYHLTGEARDFVPPSGMSMAELRADLARRNPHLDVINEGDHVHIEPSGNNAGSLRAKAQQAIAAGADPVAVRARAAQMGVDL